ncbi:DUF883 family protein [Nitratireductor mangrovi]|uniref:DUF883 family protein n=1 Tax=Nitratireductor mangrovi TaxID=2599600 RepID=A0A5B8KVV4_9HYPH|nr:DUF883 family protein [Nitratireductor mangrovi]QDY99816.1 DUF883 family protein [Nitratireductor mangrovi]
MSTARNKTSKAAAAASAGTTDADARAEFEAQIAALREELATVKSLLAGSGERSASAAKKAAASAARHLREEGEAAIEELRANTKDIEAQLVANVRRKPVTSLAIAAGVGFLIALIARR